MARADLEVTDEQIESILLACLIVAGMVLVTLIITTH